MWSPDGVAGYSGWLLETLRRQQEDGPLCDVTLQVEDATVCLHRCLLAANSAMLASVLTSLQDGQSNLYLSDVAKEGFLPLVGYMYTGRLDLTNVQPQTVLSVAQMLQMNEAEALCRQCIQNPNQKERVYPITKKTLNQDQASQTTVDMDAVRNKAPSSVDQSCQTENETELTPTSKENNDAEKEETYPILKTVLEVNKQASSNECVDQSIQTDNAPNLMQCAQCSNKISDLAAIGLRPNSYSSDDNEVNSASPTKHRQQRKTTIDPEDHGFTDVTEISYDMTAEKTQQPKKVSKTTDKHGFTDKKDISDDLITEKKIQVNKINKTPTAKTKKKSDHDWTPSIKEERKKPAEVTVLPPSADEWTCAECGLSFPSRSKLRLHASIHTSKPFKCKVCEQAFSSQYFLDVHVDKAHSSTSASFSGYTCKTCGKIFMLHKKFLKHQSYHNTCDKMGTFTCSDCGLEYKTKDGLDSHMRKHTGEKPFHCDQCGRSFSHKESVKEHMKTHSSNMEHSCEICGQKFRYKGSLRTHMSRHDEKIDCAICKKIFLYYKDLQEHNETNHSEHAQSQNLEEVRKRRSPKLTEPRLVVEIERRWPCDVCGLNFNTMSEMKDHRITQHDDDRKNNSAMKKATLALSPAHVKARFSCKDCGLAFSQKVKLVIHMKKCRKRHVNRNVHYECKKCKRRFLHQCNVMSHVKSCQRLDNMNNPCPDGAYVPQDGSVDPPYNLSMETVRKYKIKKVSVLDKNKKLSYFSLKRRKYALHQQFNCKVCKMSFSGVMAYKKHVKEKHRKNKPNDKASSCEKCQHSFTLKSLLLSHSCDATKSCEECDRRTLTYGHYKRHMLQHAAVTAITVTKLPPVKKPQPSKPRRYDCPLCEEKFSFKSQFVAHVENHKITVTNMFGKVKQMFQCKICKKMISNFKYLKRHQRFHSTGMPFPCKKCDKTFSSRSNLTRHDNFVHKKIRDKSVCEICGNTYMSKTSLDDHMAVHRGETFKCDICANEFKTRLTLIRHLRISHNKGAVNTDAKTERPVFHCSNCDQTFENKYQLSRHVKRVHPSEEETASYQCPICGKICHSKEKFTRHKSYHKNNSTRLYCQICGASFMSNCGLQNHMRKHTGDKRFSCNVCDRKFYNSSCLNEHKKIHTDERNIVCELCGEKFRYKSGLRSHMRVHMTKEHVCQVCNKAFHFEFDLRKHAISHSNERPFQCPCCEKAFKTRKHLSRHFQQIHPISQKYRCKICHNQFINQADLDLHNDRKHDIKPSERTETENDDAMMEVSETGQLADNQNRTVVLSIPEGSELQEMVDMSELSLQTQADIQAVQADIHAVQADMQADIQTVQAVELIQNIKKENYVLVQYTVGDDIFTMTQ